MGSARVAEVATRPVATDLAADDGSRIPRVLPELPTEHRRIERLERVGADARIAVGDQATEDPALGAERVGHERMGGDRDPSLLVDLGDRRPKAAKGPNALREEQAEEMAAKRRDLLADDDLDAVTELAGHRSRREGGIDPL